MRFGPIRILLLMNALLIGGLAWLWLDEGGKPRNLAWSPPRPLVPELPKVLGASNAPTQSSDVSANPTQYLAILERPLFAPDRRPPPPPAAPTAAPPPDPFESIQLTGVFTGANAGVVARVDGRSRRIKVNEPVGAWTLKSVQGRDVTFAQGADTRQLRLNYARLGPPAPPTASSSAGAAQPSGSVAPSQSQAVQNLQDEGRERLRRRNEIRAARGLPPVSE